MDIFSINIHSGKSILFSTMKIRTGSRDNMLFQEGNEEVNCKGPIIAGGAF
jgi:hypothetical protein